jgi:hypothetical protein
MTEDRAERERFKREHPEWVEQCVERARAWAEEELWNGRITQDEYWRVLERVRAGAERDVGIRRPMHPLVLLWWILVIVSLLRWALG